MAKKKVEIYVYDNSGHYQFLSSRCHDLIFKKVTEANPLSL